MKTMRFFPLIALLFLGIIVYALYKTSSFINNKVNSETLLSQDSLANHNNDTLQITNDTFGSIAISPSQPLSSDATATPNTANTTSETVVPLAIPLVSTSLATETKPSVKELKKTIKGVKKVAKADIKKSAKDSATMQPNAQTFKAANAFEKTVASEPRFHVIIGTFGVQANAKAKAAEFEKSNNKKPTIIKDGKYYRVSADSFEFGQAAAQYAQKLKEAGENNMILKL